MQDFVRINGRMHDADRRVVKRCPVALIDAVQRLNQVLLAVRRVTHQGNRPAHPNDAAVLAQVALLARELAALALQQFESLLVLLVAVARMRQLARGFAEQFGSGIAEHLAQLAIDLEYSAVGGGMHDADCDLIKQRLDAGSRRRVREPGGRGMRVGDGGNGGSVVAGRFPGMARDFFIPRFPHSRPCCCYGPYHFTQVSSRSTQSNSVARGSVRCSWCAL